MPFHSTTHIMRSPKTTANHFMRPKDGELAALHALLGPLAPTESVSREHFCIPVEGGCRIRLTVSGCVGISRRPANKWDIADRQSIHRIQDTITVFQVGWINQNQACAINLACLLQAITMVALHGRRCCKIALKVGDYEAIRIEQIHHEFPHTIKRAESDADRPPVAHAHFKLLGKAHIGIRAYPFIDTFEINLVVEFLDALLPSSTRQESVFRPSTVSLYIVEGLGGSPSKIVNGRSQHGVLGYIALIADFVGMVVCHFFSPIQTSAAKRSTHYELYC